MQTDNHLHLLSHLSEPRTPERPGLQVVGHIGDGLRISGIKVCIIRLIYHAVSMGSSGVASALWAGKSCSLSNQSHGVQN